MNHLGRRTALIPPKERIYSSSSSSPSSDNDDQHTKAITKSKKKKTLTPLNPNERRYKEESMKGFIDACTNNNNNNNKKHNIPTGNRKTQQSGQGNKASNKEESENVNPNESVQAKKEYDKETKSRNDQSKINPKNALNDTGLVERNGKDDQEANIHGGATGHNVQHSPIPGKEATAPTANQKVQHSPTSKHPSQDQVSKPIQPSKTPRGPKSKSLQMSTSKKVSQHQSGDTSKETKKGLEPISQGHTKEASDKDHIAKPASMTNNLKAPIAAPSALGAGFGRAGREARRLFASQQNAFNGDHAVISKHGLRPFSDTQKEEYSQMELAMKYMMENDTDEYIMQPKQTYVKTVQPIENSSIEMPALSKKEEQKAARSPRQDKVTAAPEKHSSPPPLPASSPLKQPSPPKATVPLSSELSRNPPRKHANVLRTPSQTKISPPLFSKRLERSASNTETPQNIKNSTLPTSSPAGRPEPIDHSSSHVNEFQNDRQSLAPEDLISPPRELFEEPPREDTPPVEDDIEHTQDVDNSPPAEPIPPKRKAPPKKMAPPNKRRQRMETPHEDVDEEEPQVGRGSKRRREKPLQYWRNERYIYAHEDGAQVPVVETVIRVPPTPQDVKPKKAPKKSGPRKTARQPSEGPEDSEEDDDGAANFCPDCTVLDDDKKEVVRRLGLRREMIQTSAAVIGGKTEYAVAKTFSPTDNVSAGVLVLPKGASKPNKNSGSSSILYAVMSGRVLVSMHRSTLDLPYGGMCMIPRGNQYSIQNIGRGEASLLFTLVKDPPPTTS